MGAPCALSDHCLPEKSLGESMLRRCSSRKRDNFVFIELDTDDFGDVIVLDVPESFREKFRKKPKHVISLDDDEGGESSDGASHANNDARTSDGCSPTEGPHPSTSAHVNEGCLFDNERHTPVKLFNSKRTYSGKSIPRSRYGLSFDSEDYSSESDGSDCELIEEFREQWEKASYRRRNGANSIPPDFENKDGTSTSSDPVRDSAEEGIAEEAELSDQQSNIRNCSSRHDCSTQKLPEQSKASEQHNDSMEIDGQYTRTHDDCISPGFDNKERSETFVPERSDKNISEQSSVNNVEPVGDIIESAGKLAEHSKFEQLNHNAKTTNEVFVGDNSANVEGDHSALIDRQQDAGKLSMPSHRKSSCGQEDEAVISDQNNIIIDRQKLKETEEYKQAMEEEWAARRQQLLHQAEEVRRLRDRKKAEKMRIMMNERRQQQRVEEIRQARRKDEENLNLKEKYRYEIKAELHRIEAISGDMASLLRCLGIHVGGGCYSSPNEVQAAYKRACLKFHPDRMSTTDLRQQVEAEEKFKLISNMKDKFLSK